MRVSARVTRTWLPWGREDVVVRRACSASWARGAVVLAVAFALVGCPGPGAPIVTIDVEGRVVAFDGTPLAGVLVHADGELTATRADGTFTLEGVASPYTLTLGRGDAEPWLHVYEGLTSPTPILAPTVDIGQLVTFRGFATGTVWGGGQLASDQVLVVCAEGRLFEVQGCGRAEGGDTSYTTVAFWSGGAVAPVRLHALRMRVDALGRPTAYLGYEIHEADLVHEATTTVNVLPLGAVSASRFHGTIVPAGGGMLLASSAWIRLDEDLALPFFTQTPGAGYLDMNAPRLGDGSAVVTAFADHPTGWAFGWLTTPIAQEFELRLPEPPSLLGPVDGALGITAATEFRAIGGPNGAKQFRWSPQSGVGGPAVSLTTARDAVRLPDPTVLGFAFVPGGTYDWLVAGVAADGLDAAAGVPLLHWLYVMYGWGLFDMPEAGAIATSLTRTVTLAP
jgi:hypothetical protein